MKKLLIIGLISHFCFTVYSMNESSPNQLLRNAVSQQNLKEATALLSHKDININAADLSSGLTALMIAAYNDDLPMVKLLLNAGAKINAQNITGFTALHYAAKNNSLNLIPVLKKAGADLKIIDENKKTAYDVSTDGIAKILLDPLSVNQFKNTDEYFVYLKDPKEVTGSTRLIVAVYKNDIKEVERLLDAQVDINDKNNQGNTALHYAANKNNKNMIQLLRKNGANLNILNHSGKRAVNLTSCPACEELLDIKNYQDRNIWPGYRPIKILRQ